MQSSIAACFSSLGNGGEISALLLAKHGMSLDIISNQLARQLLLLCFWFLLMISATTIVRHGGAACGMHSSVGGLFGLGRNQVTSSVGPAKSMLRELHFEITQCVSYHVACLRDQNLVAAVWQRQHAPIKYTAKPMGVAHTKHDACCLPIWSKATDCVLLTHLD